MPLDLLNTPGATVWAAYRADNVTLSGSDVTAWPDRSGNARDLAATGTPQYVETDTDYGSQPVIEFPGTDDYLLNDDAANDLAQPLTVIWIGECNLANATNKRAFWGSGTITGGGVPNLNWNASEVFVPQISGDGALTTTLGNDTPALIEMLFSGASSSVRVGSVIAATGTLTADGITNGICIGAIPGGNQDFGGRIAEVVIIDGVLTHQARVYLAQYVNQRYGFDFPFPQILDTVEAGFFLASTTHNVNMPATVEAGELLVANGSGFEIGFPGLDIPSGWEAKWIEESSVNTGLEGGLFVKKADGTEGGTSVNFSTGAACTMAVEVRRIALWSGNLDDIAIGVPVHAQTANPNPPNLAPAAGSQRYLWGAIYEAADDDETATGYPTNYTVAQNYVISGGGVNDGPSAGSAWRELEASSDNPGTFTLSGSEGTIANLLAVRPIGPPPTGSGAASLGAVTQQGMAAEEFSGAAAQVLGAVTQAAAAEQEFSAAGAQTLGPVSQAANASHTPPAATGAGAQTLGAASQAGSGAEELAGAGAQTLGATSQAALGSLDIAGAGAQSLAPASQAGNAAEEMSGAGAQVLGSVTQAASGEQGIEAAGAQTLAPVTQAGSGAEEFAGSGAQALAPASQQAIAVLEPDGAGAQILGAVSQQAVAQEEAASAGAQSLAPVTQSGDATQSGGSAAGAGAQTLAPVSQAGTTAEAMQGGGAQTLGPATQHGEAATDVYGAGAQVLGPVSQQGTGSGGVALAVAAARMRGFMKNIAGFMRT